MVDFSVLPLSRAVSDRVAKKIPIRINTPPTNSIIVGVSLRKNKANITVPTGSPNKAIETYAAERYLSAQLNGGKPEVGKRVEHVISSDE